MLRRYRYYLALPRSTSTERYEHRAKNDKAALTRQPIPLPQNETLVRIESYQNAQWKTMILIAVI